MAPLFTGVGVALVTLFDDDGALDAPSTAALAGQLVELGMRSVLVAGTTGEAASLNPDERTALVSAVRAAVPTDVPVIAGTGAATGGQAADLTARAFDAGADAALVLSPPTVADPRAYFDTVSKRVPDQPLMAYHFPFASAPGIPVELLPELPVVGLKDSSADPERLIREVELFEGDVYAGSSAVLTMAGAIGATGAILTLANAEPERCVAAFGGDGTAQRALLGGHLAMTRDFPVGIKCLVADRFGVSPAVRVGR